jgi:hypothetical protein
MDYAAIILRTDPQMCRTMRVCMSTADRSLASISALDAAGVSSSLRQKERVGVPKTK